jgi:hypothetical protein
MVDHTTRLSQSAQPSTEDKQFTNSSPRPSTLSHRHTSYNGNFSLLKLKFTSPRLVHLRHALRSHVKSSELDAVYKGAVAEELVQMRTDPTTGVSGRDPNTSLFLSFLPRHTTCVYSSPTTQALSLSLHLIIASSAAPQLVTNCAGKVQILLQTITHIVPGSSRQERHTFIEKLVCQHH